MLLGLWQFIIPRTCFLFGLRVLGPREWLLCHDGWHLEGLLPFKCGCIRSLQPSGYGYLSGFEFVFSIGLAYPTSECCQFPPISLSICFETSCMVSRIFCPSWNIPGFDRFVKINIKKRSVTESTTTKQNFSPCQKKIQCYDLCNCVPGVLPCFSTDTLLCAQHLC